MSFDLNASFNNLYLREGANQPPQMRNPQLQPQCTTIFQALVVANAEMNKQNADPRVVLGSLKEVKSNLVQLLPLIGLGEEHQGQVNPEDRAIIQRFAEDFERIIEIIYR